MPIRAVAFDLGNTLVEYYQMRDFPAILDQAVAGSHRVVAAQASIAAAEARQAAEREHGDKESGEVTPLFSRLRRAYGLDGAVAPELEERCCREFLRPIFRLARVYDDTRATLARLRASGYRTAIVSNTPWGSPGNLWREELARLGLAGAVDAAVFCTDVGWRKPAAPIFQAALRGLGVPAGECLFVGDHPEWDCQGARRHGLAPVLIDRSGEHPAYAGLRIQSLDQLWATLDSVGRHG